MSSYDSKIGYLNEFWLRYLFCCRTKFSVEWHLILNTCLLSIIFKSMANFVLRTNFFQSYFRTSWKYVLFSFGHGVWSVFRTSVSWKVATNDSTKLAFRINTQIILSFSLWCLMYFDLWQVFCCRLCCPLFNFFFFFWHLWNIVIIGWLKRTIFALETSFFCWLDQSGELNFMGSTL